MSKHIFILFFFVVVASKAFSFEILSKVNKEIILDKTNIYLNKPILIKNSHHITINGNGLTLWGKNPQKGIFRIVNSSDITIRNLSIDYKILPHIAGQIKSIDYKKNRILFQVYSYYEKSLESLLPLLFSDKRLSKKQKIYFYPLKSPGIVKTKGTIVSFVKKIQKLTKTTYAITCKTLKHNIKLHDTLVLVFRQQGASAVHVKNSKNITLSDINIYASPAAAFVSKNTSSLIIEKCHVLLKKNRWLSANAGGINCQSSRIGPAVRSNHFEGMGDDGVNIYTTPMYLHKQVDAHTILVRPKSFFKMLQKNDLMAFFNPNSGEIISQVKIQDYYIKKHQIYLTFSKLPPLSKSIQLYDLNLTGQGFSINNNIFTDSRRHGILLKSRNGIVENNLFQNLGGSAVVLGNILKYHKEGLNSENIVIRHNSMKNCGFGAYKPLPLIQIYFTGMEHYADNDVQKNITIKNNTLKPYEKNFFIRNVHNMVLDN